MKPYYSDALVTLYLGDCREILDGLGSIDATVADPPYEETALGWDKRVTGWLDTLPGSQLWCFGSFRFWMVQAPEMDAAGWSFAQEIVWEKHNGSGLQNDRFKRVHELVTHWYRGDWASLYRDVPTTPDATARTVRRKAKPTHHQGALGPSYFTSDDGGPRLMRSVIPVRSCHGYAQHPTQKPLGILAPLIQFSVPVGGVVLDPFCGSGSTLVAARDMGRRAIGIELDEKYAEIAAERCRQTALDFGAA